MKESMVRRRVAHDVPQVLAQLENLEETLAEARRLSARLVTDREFTGAGIARGRELARYVTDLEAQVERIRRRIPGLGTGPERRVVPVPNEHDAHLGTSNLLPNEPTALAENVLGGNPNGPGAHGNGMWRQHLLDLRGGLRSADWNAPDREMLRAIGAEAFIAQDAFKRRLQGWASDLQPNFMGAGGDGEAMREIAEFATRMRTSLESADLWGTDLAQTQQRVNQRFHNWLRNHELFDSTFLSRDVALRKDAVDPTTGEGVGRSASGPGYRRPRNADPAKVRTFLNGYGLARNDRRMRIFDEVLQSRAELSATIAELYDLPPELSGRAGRAPQTIREMREVLKEVGERAEVLNQWRAATADDRRFGRLASMGMGMAQVAAFAGAGGFAQVFGLGAAIAGIRGNRANLARGVAHLRKMAAEWDTGVVDSVRTFLRGSSRPVRRAIVSGGTAAIRADYKKRIAELETRATPQQMAAHVAEVTAGFDSTPRGRCSGSSATRAPWTTPARFSRTCATARSAVSRLRCSAPSIPRSTPR
jgi:hypothetical protein